MSVIGRLDGQVEEVLINPVGRRKAAGEPTDGRTDEQTRAAAGQSDARDEAETARPRAETAEETAAGRRQQDALPVWLL